MIEWNYKKGKREGISREYYKSGKLKIEENYKNGQKINKKVYHKTGELKSEKDYPN